MVFECPFAHESYPSRIDSINDQLGIVECAEVLAEQRTGIPDLLQNAAVVHNVCDSGNPDLIVVGIQVAQFHVGVGLDFDRLVVTAEVGNIDRKSVSTHRRHGSNSGLVSID